MIAKLDGSNVLFLSQEDDFGVVLCGEEPDIPIRYLAICKYESDFSYYLFLLDEHLEVITDWLFDSVEKAMDFGRQKNQNVKWVQSEYQPNTTEELFEMLQDNADMSTFEAVCCGLSEKTDDLSIWILKELLRNKDCYKRRLVLESIGRHMLYRQLIPDIVQCLNDNSQYVVCSSLNVISSTGITEAYNDVKALTDSQNIEIRKCALNALKRISE